MARTKSIEGADGPAAAPSPDDDIAGYRVVARRYRPQRFEDVVGQDHVVQALRNAIRLNRVTHAYLFSGTRGFGKTSMARIFAKCLNCARGPTDEPCLECDICRAIAAGQDVDVIEIDGASNNGVEAVRELRQNAGLRPSRSRFKIYYIDEVHMLSTGAFNALLKTLEEPPEHVKFFFATTEPNKIPITVLSRCQRYDFAGISPEKIVETLAGICAREKVEADVDALRAVARRAAGSMRDAQSLLEQLLSFGESRLTVDLVHRSLGIAPDDRVLDLLDALAGHDPGRALRILDDSIDNGVQPVDLLQGALDYLRDVMVTAAGAEVPPLAATPAQMGRLKGLVEGWSFDSVLAAMQILSEARQRMRGSPHGRLLVELAFCRVARLEDLADLGTLIGRLAAIESGEPAPSAPKKKRADDPPMKAGAVASVPSAIPPITLPVAAVVAVEDLPPPGKEAAAEEPAGPPPSLESVERAWNDLISKVGIDLGTKLSRVRPGRIEGGRTVVVSVGPRYNYVADACERPESRRKIDEVLTALLGGPASLRFDRAAADPEAPSAAPSPQTLDLTGDPIVKRVVELFEARKVKVEVEGDEPVS